MFKVYVYEQQLPIFQVGVSRTFKPKSTAAREKRRHSIIQFVSTEVIACNQLVPEHCRTFIQKNKLLKVNLSFSFISFNKVFYLVEQTI